MIDYNYLAAFEKSAKKARLMTTPVFDGFKTQAIVDTPGFGNFIQVN